LDKHVSYYSIKEDIFNGSVSVKSLLEDYFQRIEQTKSLNIFLEVFTESARKQAEAVEQKIKAGKAGKLAGMIVAIKDNICYKGHKVSAASKMLANFESLYSATAVNRLLEEDAIIIGRVNCDEFAMGSSNENSAYGAVLNPVNPKKVPGGSSGGSAAAVKAGLCMVALGSDTGGSIRQPASFCGTVGFKPTYGRVSRYGLIAFASSFDQIGPLSNSVEDSAMVMEVISGYDEHDATSASNPVPRFVDQVKDEKYKIAYIKQCIESPGLDEEIKSFFKAEVARLQDEGHTLVEVDFDYLDYLIPTYYVISTAEASSNLSRYDGIHYGFRSKDAQGIEDTYLKTRSEGFGEEVKRRILLGTFVLSSGYYDAYFEKAQKVRRIVAEKTQEILKEHDFIMLPTTPSTAFNLGENISDPIQMYLQDIYTVQANLVGVPAISLPLGNHSDGLPFGIQFMAEKFQDEKLLTFSRQLNNIR
jgi:aspartyl-tRNA(Asn)/glutamyl-tRNA(Gln) amidotransferase subunit A